MILLTGATGYIGSHTAVELLNSGEDAVIVDDLSNSEASVIDRIEQKLRDVLGCEAVIHMDRGKRKARSGGQTA